MSSLRRAVKLSLEDGSPPAGGVGSARRGQKGKRKRVEDEESDDSHNKLAAVAKVKGAETKQEACERMKLDIISGATCEDEQEALRSKKQRSSVPASKVRDDPETSRRIDSFLKGRCNKEAPAKDQQNAAAGVSKTSTTVCTAESTDIILPKVKKNKNGETEGFGRIQSCLCPNPAVCRGLVWRWIALGEEKYSHFQVLPSPKLCQPYRLSLLRSLGYDVADKTITRMSHVGKQEASVDKKKIFSGALSLIHYHPEVIEKVIDAKNNVCAKLRKDGGIRIPLHLGEKIGLKDEDKCPTPDSEGNETYFAWPNYSMEQAAADVEKAEEEYKQNASKFISENETLCKDISINPSKYAMKMRDLEKRCATLFKANIELKEQARHSTALKNKAQRQNTKLLRGVEKLARRADKLELSHNVGALHRGARDIYKEVTGKDLSEDGFFRVEPTGLSWSKGRSSMDWVDPRIDIAFTARWNNPSMSMEEALKIGGFHYPDNEEPDKKKVDAEGVTLHKRKRMLYACLKGKRDQAKIDPEAAREYEERFPKGVKLPGVYGGLDLNGIPEQPHVYSKRAKSGYRGVKEESGKYSACVGDGTNGGKILLGTFKTLEEAASIYAKAKYYMQHCKSDPDESRRKSHGDHTINESSPREEQIHDEW